jgi:hypothetical protein
VDLLRRFLAEERLRGDRPGTIGTGMVLAFELLIELELLLVRLLVRESAGDVPDPS